MHKTPCFAICVVTDHYAQNSTPLHLYVNLSNTELSRLRTPHGNCPRWQWNSSALHQQQLHVKQCHSLGTLEEFKKPFISNWNCNSRQSSATRTTPKKLYFSSSLKWGKLRSSCGNEFQKLLISCRSSSRIEIICVCIPIPKELNLIAKTTKKVGTLRSIPLKAKENAACVVLEMQKSPHHSYTKCVKATFSQ